MWKESTGKDGWGIGTIKTEIEDPAKLTNLTSPASVIKIIKVFHTAVWAAFAVCIFAWEAALFWATLSIGIVFIEVLVLILNGWRCPLTSIAARYTDDRRDNFDIYLPERLARHNKSIFGILYLGAFWSRFFGVPLLSTDVQDPAAELPLWRRSCPAVIDKPS